MRMDGLIRQMLPWSRPIHDTKWVANAGEGWESNCIRMRLCDVSTDIP